MRWLALPSCNLVDNRFRGLALIPHQLGVSQTTRQLLQLPQQPATKPCCRARPGGIVSAPAASAIVSLGSLAVLQPEGGVPLITQRDWARCPSSWCALSNILAPDSPMITALCRDSFRDLSHGSLVQLPKEEVIVHIEITMYVQFT